MGFPRHPPRHRLDIGSTSPRHPSDVATSLPPARHPRHRIDIIQTSAPYTKCQKSNFVSLQQLSAILLIGTVAPWTGSVFEQTIAKSRTPRKPFAAAQICFVEEKEVAETSTRFRKLVESLEKPLLERSRHFSPVFHRLATGTLSYFHERHCIL